MVGKSQTLVNDRTIADGLAQKLLEGNPEGLDGMTLKRSMGFMGFLPKNGCGSILMTNFGGVGGSPIFRTAQAGASFRSRGCSRQEGLRPDVCGADPHFVMSPQRNVETA